MEELVLAAVNTFNQRAGAALGIGEGETGFASEQQWALTSTGLDIDQDALLALAMTIGEMMGNTAREHPDRSTSALADGLRQMFVLGALHEQEHARRDAVPS